MPVLCFLIMYKWSAEVLVLFYECVPRSLYKLRVLSVHHLERGPTSQLLLYPSSVCFHSLCLGHFMVLCCCMFINIHTATGTDGHTGCCLYLSAGANLAYIFWCN